jgi:glycosyltransferase involved in cell wall biosynthesis
MSLAKSLFAKHQFCIATVDAELASIGDSRNHVIPNKKLAKNDFKGNLSRLFWYTTRLKRVLRRTGCDKVFIPLPEGSLLPCVKQVVTVHDLLPLRYPECYPRLHYYFKFLLPRVLSRTSAIVCDSATTKRDLQEWLPGLKKKTYVVYPGYDSGLFRQVDSARILEVRQRMRLPAKYILTVGESRPYKRFERAVEAVALLKDKSISLVVVGNKNKLDGGLANLPNELGITDRVLFTGRVDDDDLVALYSGATAFVFPTLYEGFGLPVIEAMACGCPVVCSDIPTLREVAGTAAIFCKPDSVDAIVEGLDSVLSSQATQESLRSQGLVQCQQFTWDKASSDIAQIMNDL